MSEPDAPTPSPGITYPELPEDLKRGLSIKSLKYFGAGAIMASVTIGSGETLFASQSGAVFGYALMWCFIGGTIMKGIQVYVAGRHMVLTGEHPMTHWGHMPGPKNWVPWLFAILSIASYPFWLAGLPLMLGQTINWIFKIDVSVLGMTAAELKTELDMAKADPSRAEYYQQLLANQAELWNVVRGWAMGAVAAAVALTWFQTYKMLERLQLFVVGILLASLAVACLASRPDLFAAIGGLVPSVPTYPDWISSYDDIVKNSEWVFVATCLGAIGGGTYDYLGYVGCFREKGWGALSGHRLIRDEDVRTTQRLALAPGAENLDRARKWLIPVKIDVGVGFLAVLAFTACFIMLGAVVLHQSQDVPNKFALLSKQASFLTQFHPSLLYVYQVGIFMAFWGTIHGAYEIYIRTAYECIMPLSERARAMPERTFRKWVLLYCASGAVILIWLGGDNPAGIVKPAAIVGGVFACGLWCFAMIWADRRFLPRNLQMNPLLFGLTLFSGTVLTLLGAFSIYKEYIAKLFS